MPETILCSTYAKLLPKGPSRGSPHILYRYAGTLHWRKAAGNYEDFEPLPHRMPDKRNGPTARASSKNCGCEQYGDGFSRKSSEFVGMRRATTPPPSRDAECRCPTIQTHYRLRTRRPPRRGRATCSLPILRLDPRRQAAGSGYEAGVLSLEPNAPWTAGSSFIPFVVAVFRPPALASHLLRTFPPCFRPYRFPQRRGSLR